MESTTKRRIGETNQMTNGNPPSSQNLLVANLNQISLEKLVKSKLEVILQQHKEGGRIKMLTEFGMRARTLAAPCTSTSRIMS